MGGSLPPRTPRRPQVGARRRALPLFFLATLLAVGVATPAHAADARRLSAGTVLVTNLDSNSVTAIAPTSHRLTVITGPSAELNGPLGIAITPDASTAYVTNSLGDTITPVSLTGARPALGAPVRVGSGPVAIAITPNGDEAYVSDFNENTVTPVSLTTHPATAGAPIHVGDGPWSIAVTPDGRDVLVSDSESDSVSVISTSTRAVTSVNVGGRPGAIAVAPDGETAYVASGDDVVPLDLAGATVDALAPIAVANGPVGIAITPSGARAFTANTDDTVTPLDLSGHVVTAGSSSRVGTLSQPDGIAIAPNGATAYAANASDDVTPINLTTTPITAEAPVAVGSASFGIAIVPDEAPVARLMVTTALAGKVTRFNASTSSAVNDPIAQYHWSFGDGTTLTTTTPYARHVYRTAGHYEASVTETSRDGTTSARTFTGQTVSNNGTPSATTTLGFAIEAPLRLSPASGTPGEEVTLRDADFAPSCNPVNVFFDGRLVATAPGVDHVVDDRSVVVPGDAPAGTDHVELSCTTSSPWAATAPSSSRRPRITSQSSAWRCRRRPSSSTTSSPREVSASCSCS